MKRENHPGDRESPAILVIDDEQGICDFFVDLFDEYGVSIDTALSGTAGLNQALAHSYSLVFLDVKLGDINGIEVLKQIKQKKPATRVVMISGYLTESVIESALELGADGYLYKPISVRDLLPITLKYVDLRKFRKKEKDS